jgi:large subunit ribosomal protein L23
MEIVVKPLVTEKMNSLTEKLNRYGFIVNKESNKIEVKKAVEKLYNVTVTDVKTFRYTGKVKSRNTKTGLVVGRTSSFKKAIVSLKEGESIDFYSNI